MNSSPQRTEIDTEQIHEFLDNGTIQAALVSVCTYAETERRAGRPVIPEGPEGRQLMTLMERVYETCIDQDLIEEYALFYQATRYVPHGALIQPIMDRAMARFSGVVGGGQGATMSESDKDVLRIFVDLSLEAYDKLGSFRVFLNEFREFIPFASLPKAIAIAQRLNDEKAIEELTNNMLHPPDEVDQSGNQG